MIFFKLIRLRAVIVRLFDFSRQELLFQPVGQHLDGMCVNYIKSSPTRDARPLSCCH